MIRAIARGAALIALVVDLSGAWLARSHGRLVVPPVVVAIVTGLALVPCALSFIVSIAPLAHWRGVRRHGRFGMMRLPLVVPRGYVGAAVLGGLATLTAMGQPFALYILAAGTVLIALALSQARARR